LLVVRTMKLGSYGVSAEPFRSASAGGVVVPLLPVMSPAHQGEGGAPILSRTRACPLLSVFSLHLFTRMAQGIDS
jgi:hypothetical protein